MAGNDQAGQDPSPDRPAEARRVRPSRGARWAIGLPLTAVALMITLAAAAVALGSGVVSSLDDPLLRYDTSVLTQQVRARVLDVDPGDGIGAGPSTFDSADTVDVEFDAPDQHVVTTVDWLAGDLPKTGDDVEVWYDPADPEYSALPEPSLQALRQRAAAPRPPSGSASDPAGSVAGVSAVLAVLIFGGTAIWAVRAPRPQRPAVPPWGQPGWGPPVWGQPGWGQPVWGQPVWGQPGWGPSGPAWYLAPPPGAGPAGYPPAGSPIAAEPTVAVPGSWIRPD